MHWWFNNISTDDSDEFFRLTYNMVLNLLRVEEVNPEYMMERSFFQFQNYSNIPKLYKGMLLQCITGWLLHHQQSLYTLTIGWKRSGHETQKYSFCKLSFGKIIFSVTRFSESSPFWQNLQSLGQFLRVYLLFGNILDRLWQILYANGQVFIDVNSQMSTNKLVIWSHWSFCV